MKKLKPTWRAMPPERGFPENLLEIGWRLQQLRMVGGKHRYVTIMINHKSVVKSTAAAQNTISDKPIRLLNDQMKRLEDRT